MFFLAARRCNEFRQLPSGRQQFLQVPSLVCYAFSVELGLKALALFQAGKAPRGHDLRKLFDTLSPALQARIISDAGFPKHFASDLDLVRETFETWRYIHETQPVDTDLGFLQRLAHAVQKALEVESGVKWDPT